MADRDSMERGGRDCCGDGVPEGAREQPEWIQRRRGEKAGLVPPSSLALLIGRPGQELLPHGLHIERGQARPLQLLSLHTVTRSFSRPGLPRESAQAGRCQRHDLTGNLQIQYTKFFTHNVQKQKHT